eukprot:CAMPEP_0196711784 /NCGR_PEP_ID=MMETSP1090-20130531/73033_1 /TAXON_ID=37098 /ORGANISM="Isochrysis sp, Strain CCMP1244" /LENGTH=40 /DNA_ID= /DNA_START= /DNA_END= /DNA_ORIENTATION=
MLMRRPTISSPGLGVRDDEDEAPPADEPAGAAAEEEPTLR